MAMDRIQLLLVGLPLFLFTTDVFDLFLTRPPPPPPSSKPSHHHHHHHHNPKSQPSSSYLHQIPDFPTEKSNAFGGVGVGHTATIDFCSSCSYRSTAVAMKNMLETQIPGIHVVLANYPSSPPKRILSKLVPVVQVGTIAVIMAGDLIFPRFGTISATWLLGNFFQSSLQSSGAFEVYCDREPVFSKLKEKRFPGEIELRDLVGQSLTGLRIVDGVGANMWS